LLIVDGVVGFNGGINFSRTHSSRPGQQSPGERLTDGWRDTHVAVYGPAVAALQQVFEQNWNAAENENARFDAPLFDMQHAGDDSVLVMAAKGGNDTESPIYHAYLEAIRLARERVWITQAYFVPDKRLLGELESAARRGVDVRMVVPGLIDSQTVLHASRSHYGRLLKHGIRIYETTTSVMHAKTAVVDRIWATVGSSNLDPRSKLHNDEVNVIVFSSDFAQQLELLFVADRKNARTLRSTAGRHAHSSSAFWSLFRGRYPIGCSATYQEFAASIASTRLASCSGFRIYRVTLISAVASRNSAMGCAVTKIIEIP
jgi:cardiolipin synthase